MERYTVLKTGEQKEWLEGCPIKVDKYNILIDNQTGSNVLQIKYTVLGNRTVKSMWVDVHCYDDANDFLLTIGDVIYANINVAAKTSFGANQPIAVNSGAVGSIKVAIKKIAFDNDEVWRNDEGAIGIVIPEQPAAREAYGELYHQFYIEAVKAKVSSGKQFLNADTYWCCTCGQANSANAQKCIACGADFAILAKISDKEYLTEQNRARIEYEKAEAERLAKVRAERERIEAEKAEQERIEREKRYAEEYALREKLKKKRKKIVQLP